MPRDGFLGAILQSDFVLVALLFFGVPVAIAFVSAVYAASQEDDPIMEQLLEFDSDDWATWIFLAGYLMPIYVVAGLLKRLFTNKVSRRE